MGYQVFISYSTDDMNLVNELANELKKKQIEVYIAEHYPEPGQSLPGKIERNINSSDALVVLLTRNGSRSAWVQQEIGFAKGKSKLIIPLIGEGVKIKGFIEGIEYIQIESEKIQKTFGKLLPTIEKLKQEKDRNQLLLWLAIGAFLIYAFSR